jgi:hypothetical protein
VPAQSIWGARQHCSPAVSAAPTRSAWSKRSKRLPSHAASARSSESRRDAPITFPKTRANGTSTKRTSGGAQSNVVASPRSRLRFRPDPGGTSLPSPRSPKPLARPRVWTPAEARRGTRSPHLPVLDPETEPQAPERLTRGPRLNRLRRLGSSQLTEACARVFTPESLGDRPMAGHQTLTLAIKVRILVPQRRTSAERSSPHLEETFQP